ncbi:MAG TPA: protein translocase subunit SecD [Tepidisphaeraceae bacterium]|jgi:SecD/SecF fusion protein
MPTNHLNRVLLITFVLWVSLSAIYQRVPGSLFWLLHPTGPVNLNHSLRPGIDIAGGTSLTYEIKSEGSNEPDLAERVASVLKKRVDPNGVKNLVWRPSGANRLEIQMPLSRRSEEAEKAQAAYVAAREALAVGELKSVAVRSDLERLTGNELQARIDQLAAGSPKRADLLKSMAEQTARIKAARAAKNSEEAARGRLAYEKSEAELMSTNVPVSQVEDALQQPPKQQAETLKKLRDKLAEAPPRLTALEQFVKAYTAFAPLRDKLDDVASLKRRLTGSGVLSFHILADEQTPGLADMIARLKAEGPRPQPGDTTRWFVVDNPAEFVGRAVEYNGKWYVLGYNDPEHAMVNAPGLPQWGLAGARVGTDDMSMKPTVEFTFDAAGSRLFGELTGKFKQTAQRRYALGIVLDDKLYSAPNIESQIFANGRISGDYSRTEAEDLATTLSAGALPAQLTDQPISETFVGPQLGKDNLRAGLVSCAAGLVVVAVFMIGYYYLSGVVAFVAVLINLIVICGCMAFINATFTLPGIAGVVLSVAMAVDANVLIFERLREEQARGLSLKMALRNSYDRALSAILDGQVTTAISSVFLFWFGSEEVRGFGLTLLIGIITSLFTALYVTKTIFAILIDKFGLDDLGSLPRTYPRWNKALTPNVDWIGKAWIFATFSAIFCGIGLTLFVVKLRSGEALDIEFSGGTTVQVSLRPEYKAEFDRGKLQDLVDDISRSRPGDLAAPKVIAVGNDGLQYQISTPTSDTTKVQAAVVEGLGERLDARQSSKFKLSDADLASAENAVLFPIENAQSAIADIPATELAAHVGGVAIVLGDVTPPLSAEQVRERITERLLQEESQNRPESVTVEALGDGRIAVLMSDSRFSYDTAKAEAVTQWRAGLAGPAWAAVREAVSSPPALKGVTKFDSQVAEEAKTNTLVAMMFSVLGIMAYIWLRFGNLKFGLATVVACVHDAAIVIAAIGMSYYLGQIAFFENVLLIRPFRVDLTLVAAVLTVIGYSMNDTVVVFDRVRENRGRYGALSRGVINDSINQTLSRTLLTGGTSIVILLVMYVIGGEGIHAFTFAMLLGIIVGTYSSIAIAAPILLLGDTSTAAAGSRSVGPQPAAG